MHDFIYVTKAEAKPIRDELYEIIRKVQDIVRPYFTFQFKPVGSSSRNMITRDRKSNIGFDFDFDLVINNYNKYNPAKTRHVIRKAIDQVAPEYGYKHCEDSTSVLTIKKVNSHTSRIIHSYDFALTNINQQYIRYNKRNRNYTWEFQGKEFKNLDNKIAWLKRNGYWTKLRDYYLKKKNHNNNPNKHSRSIFAESINEMYQRMRR